MEEDFNKIEKKWQAAWEKKKAFKTSEKGRKYYVLEMFPYPSASGLHMGHAFNYTIGDVFSRFKRMQGFSVLYPMGYDSLGLPAENAAIKAKTHPKKFTEKAIKNFIEQQKALGLSYDWDKLVITYEPEYMKFNQYFFLQFLKAGLVYRKKAPVNWCKKCQTVLANEQVHNGFCWRHKEQEVETKQLEQWFIKTTKYSEELLKDIEKLDWPERIKIMQKNWIGKSEGVDIYFKLENSNKLLPTFTTRCDTTFSVTFLAIAPENPIIDELVKGTKYEKGAEKFIKKVAKEKIEDRTNEEKEKEGFFIGKYAINPLNNEKIPIYIANFAVMYGSGIVMCDAHDKRDFRFAKKYKIPLKFVISKDGKKVDANKAEQAYTDNGILFDSKNFSGMNNMEALPKMADWIQKQKYGKKTINYKLKDWLVSRQRYWGTPIPIVYCEKCGIVPIPEKDLPIKLPEKVEFGKGNPLLTNKSWLNTTCPKCKSSNAKRETDTMDTFYDSSWYFLRYIDNKNKKSPFDKKKANKWMPIDQYIGGAEHACMHLIYARFFTKALRDLKFLNIDEPFKSLFNQGMLHGEDGHVMSKSRGNVINPLDMIKKYSADILRFYLISTASPEKDFSWSDEAIQGTAKLINKIRNYFSKLKKAKPSKLLESKLNSTIEKITKNIEGFQYNLAIINLRQLFEAIEQESIDKKTAEIFLKLLSPFCPHITEELWNKLGNKDFISLSSWPKADKKKINPELEKQEEQKQKLISDISNIINILKQKKELKNKKEIKVYTIPTELEIYKTTIQKIQKSFNLETSIHNIKDAKQEGKKIKASPGKPGILIE